MPCRHIDQTPSSVEFCDRIGHLKTDCFKFPDRLSKGFSPIAVPSINLRVQRFSGRRDAYSCQCHNDVLCSDQR
jgi:hypothetical protein